MFYQMINSARDQWFSSESCTVKSIVGYIVKTGQMRDAQIEAIKTYLFLKIACNNKPLSELFRLGVFNTFNLNEIDLSAGARTFLEETPAAVALLEYSMLKDDSGNQISEITEKSIKKDYRSIDYDKFWSDNFYGVTYTDYLFSLPMGAGKTYLMAAFIYLDLYFASNEPANPAFAHNFVILAPSGLKASVVPSLRTIQKFDPSWILDEPAASDLKRKMIFEVLDQNKTKAKSNKTKDPNVQKIANHQPFHELFGLVVVTNAEKVILNRVKIVQIDGQLTLQEETDDVKDKQANELRNLLGKLPSLSIFIDEVHHASSSTIDDEKKLRAVVNKWSENRTINSVIGFSGTPYLQKEEKIKVADKLTFSTAEMSNIVYYYPLVDGIGNFLKRPLVKISNVKDSTAIIDKGVREFLDTYKDKVYSGELVAKLGIYCGTIEKLEQIVYPLVSGIVTKYDLPVDCVLKFHGGNGTYPQPQDSQYQFDTLDSPTSNVRIVLLVQIGKEGWDCRSLTGIILSQESDCPQTMVLQTSCRCLRQVEKNVPETALIYLNESNAKTLNAQLMKEQHISIKELENGGKKPTVIKRYDRTMLLGLPPINFYQLKVKYETQTLETADPKAAIQHSPDKASISGGITRTWDIETRQDLSIEVDDDEHGTKPAAFITWLYSISKSSFGFVKMSKLKAHEALLADVFKTITFERDGIRYFSSKFDISMIEANIRKGFCDKRDFLTKDELVPNEAKLLNIDNFNAEESTFKPEIFFPAETVVKNIVAADAGKLKLDAKTEQLLQLAEETGNVEFAQKIREQHSAHPARMRSFHYLPYKRDSKFEETFLSEVLKLTDIADLSLEVYYNGDRGLTEFKIACYKQNHGRWDYIGKYTPDFLIIRRKDGQIHQAVIVETKGSLYAYDPTFIDKRSFMQTFMAKNNAEYGYRRFDYLYLEDDLPVTDRIIKTHQAITDFFKEDAANA